MKFCSDEWKNRVENYIEGQLPAADLESTENHLKTCTICAETVAEAEQIKAAIHSLPKVTVSETFDSRLKSRLDKIQSEKRNPLFKYFEVYVIVFLMIIGAITYLGFELFSELQNHPTKKNEPTEQKEVVHPHGVDGL